MTSWRAPPCCPRQEVGGHAARRAVRPEVSTWTSRTLRSVEAEADLQKGPRAGAHDIVARKESSRIFGWRPLVRLAPARAFNPTRPINFPVIGASFTSRRLVAGEMAGHARPRCLGERAAPPRGTSCYVYQRRGRRRPQCTRRQQAQVGPPAAQRQGGPWWGSSPWTAAATSEVVRGGGRGQGGAAQSGRVGGGAAAAVRRPSCALGVRSAQRLPMPLRCAKSWCE